jgi:ribosome recycling factor
MQYNFSQFKKNVDSVYEWLQREFSQIRTGQANPAILDQVKVEAFGSYMSIKEVASVQLDGARSLRVSPWDKSQIKAIEKAITTQNLGLSVVVDDQGLRINFPELTQDRRQEIVKLAKSKLEEAKKNVRKHRDDTQKDIDAKEKSGGFGKDDIFRFKGEMQKIVDEANKKLDQFFEKKEKELLG